MSRDSRRLEVVPPNYFRLVTLGRFSLVGPGNTDEESLGKRPRKLALLTVLALANRPLPRDVLVEMFWGDTDEARARHSLADALSHLRHVLGHRAVALHRSEVALADDLSLSVDARELEAAADRKEADRVIELYQGPFLHHVQISYSRSFEDFVDRERARLAGLFVQSCQRRCLALARTRNWDACAAIAERWLDCEPLSADAALYVLNAIKAPATRDALRHALARYSQLTARLHADFETRPALEVRALAADLSERLRLLDGSEIQPSIAAVAATPPANTSDTPSISQSAAPPRAAVDHARIGADGEPTTAAQPDRRRWRNLARRIAVAAVATSVAVLAVRWARNGPRPALAVGGPKALAIAPFRVAGADSSLAFLGEGMIDLLAAKLDGAVGPRVVDAQRMMSAWRRAERSDGAISSDVALATAREVGAQQVLVGGSVVGTPSRLILSGSVLAVPTGVVIARASVAGPVDSLSTLVDRFAAQLLAADVRDAARLSDLTSRSLPALRAFLLGQTAYRHGRFTDAALQYSRALEQDSAFALAVLGLATAEGWGDISQSEQSRRGVDAAWALSSRLSRGDQLLFAAVVGPRYPALRSAAQGLADWEAALYAARDRADVWYQYGDRLFHLGPALGIPDAHARAASAFRQAIALDSSLSAPLGHLVEIAIHGGDTAQARRLGSLYFARDSGAAAADFLRWRLAHALRDSSTLLALRRGLVDLDTRSLDRIRGVSQLDAVGLEISDGAGTIVQARATSPDAQLLSYSALHALALNAGRQAQAVSLAAAIGELNPFPAGVTYQFFSADQLVVLDALFGDGDRLAADRAAHRLAVAARNTPGHDPASRATHYTDMCTLELWRLAHRDTRTAASVIGRLRAVRADVDSSGLIGGHPIVCVAMLEASLAVARGGLDARARLNRLDSIMLRRPHTFGAEFGNFVVARLREQRGDRVGALAAIRRRPYYHFGGTVYLAAALREEGRLAALVGDRAGAVRAYQHFLTLRRDADAPLRDEVERVRAALRALDSSVVVRR